MSQIKLLISLPQPAVFYFNKYPSPLIQFLRPKYLEFSSYTQSEIQIPTHSVDALGDLAPGHLTPSPSFTLLGVEPHWPPCSFTGIPNKTQLELLLLPRSSSPRFWLAQSLNLFSTPMLLQTHCQTLSLYSSLFSSQSLSLPDNLLQCFKCIVCLLPHEFSMGTDLCFGHRCIPNA